jgi:hypothetical protein
VLVQAIRDGLSLLTWQTDTLAYAESYDDDAIAAVPETSRAGFQHCAEIVLNSHRTSCVAQTVGSETPLGVGRD